MNDAGRPATAPGVLLWQRAARRAGPMRILPDGCLDLIWDGEQLFVAGPDSAVRWHHCGPETHYAGLRFSGGTGPAFLGIPADELADRVVPLAELWPAALAARLASRVAERPAAALEACAGGRLRDRPADPLGPALLAMTQSGLAVAAIARRLALSERQLHRRCLALFGYGPRHLRRVLRMNRALQAATAGAPLAGAAAAAGYADQAHFSRDTTELAGTSPARLLREWGYSSGANRSTGVPSGSRSTA